MRDDEAELLRIATGFAEAECLDESGYCVFCDEPMVSEGGPHKDSCLWMAARGVVKRYISVAATGEPTAQRSDENDD